MKEEKKHFESYRKRSPGWLRALPPGDYQTRDICELVRKIHQTVYQRLLILDVDYTVVTSKKSGKTIVWHWEGWEYYDKLHAENSLTARHRKLTQEEIAKAKSLRKRKMGE